MMILQISFIV